MASYSDKLKDPRWQRRRLEIMGRDDFHCAECGSETETLHVHHKAYVRGKEPWDYPDAMLITLCEGCHDSAHSEDNRRKLSNLVAMCLTESQAADVFSSFQALLDQDTTGCLLAEVINYCASMDAREFLDGEYAHEAAPLT